MTTAKLLRIALTIMALATFGSVFLPNQSVSAANSSKPCENGNIHWGRQNCHGFYTDKLASTDKDKGGDVVISGGIDNVTDLKSYLDTMKGFLYGSDVQAKTGAAWTMTVMMGRGPQYYGGSVDNGIRWAQDPANYNNWAALITAYDKAGLVQWNTTKSYTDYYEDSGYSHDTLDNYYATYPPTTADVIIFKVPPGAKGDPFVIDRSCANIKGSDQGLPTLSTPPKGDLNPPTPPGPNPPGNPSGYSQGNPALSSSCQTISGHAFNADTPNVGTKVTITYSIGGPPVTTTASTSGTHLFTIDTPANVRNSLEPVTITGQAADSSGNLFPLAKSPITIGPCKVIAASCVNTTTIPASPDPNTPYSLRASIQYGSAGDAAIAVAQPDFKFYLKITGPDGPKVVYDNKNVPSVTRNGNLVSVQVDNLPPTGNTGTYDVSWGITAKYGGVSCPSSSSSTESHAFTTLNKPYFNVFGGDVSVGSAMNTAVSLNCSDSTAVKRDDFASVVGRSLDPANDNYAGAGGQYAVFALNRIQEFATAQGHITLPTEPSGLSFANSGVPVGTVNSPTGLYGGKFAGSGCIPNYYANLTPSRTAFGPVALSAVSTPGYPTFPAGGNIPNGARLTYYINGNLLIDEDVTFSGNYASTADIPVVAFVVKGNILIAPNVKRLDGFYIAQPATNASKDGIIFTCAPKGFATQEGNVLNKDLQGACNNQLTVNGSFVARQIWPLRTAGNVSTTPAETFNYIPELWLTSPFGSGLSTTYTDYDAITSLPPVL